MQLIEARLAALPDSLSPLRSAAARYLRYPSVLSGDGTLHIGHRPWVAELNYLIVLYPGIEKGEIERYCQRFRTNLPPSYADFLQTVGGMFCFGMSLCGIPQSMRGGVPLLDRSVLQCHDLGTANQYWAAEYRVPDGLFHFGSRAFSARENVGYFIDRSGRFLAIKKRGKVVGEWPDITAFLADELKASEELEEKLYPSQWVS